MFRQCFQRLAHIDCCCSDLQVTTHGSHKWQEPQTVSYAAHRSDQHMHYINYDPRAIPEDVAHPRFVAPPVEPANPWYPSSNSGSTRNGRLTDTAPPAPAPLAPPPRLYNDRAPFHYQHAAPPPATHPSPGHVAPLALPSDRTCLTVYQMLLRQSLEYFTATTDDVESRVRGRKQKIRLGQLGVRCRYCAHLPVSQRGKGAVYYPKTLLNVYQAAQNIAGAHLSCEDEQHHHGAVRMMGAGTLTTTTTSCPYLPAWVAEEIAVQKPRRDASKAGRSYWVEACKNMGVMERDGGLWLANSAPIEGTTGLLPGGSGNNIKPVVVGPVEEDQGSHCSESTSANDGATTMPTVE